MRGRPGLVVVGLCVSVVVGCGSFLSLGDDDDDDPPLSPGSSGAVTPPLNDDASIASGDAAAPPDDNLQDDGGAPEASLIDAADAAPACIRRLEQCLESSQCCGSILGGQFKEVCRSSPRVCDRCAQTGEPCAVRAECCGIAICSGGFCEGI